MPNTHHKMTSAFYALALCLISVLFYGAAGHDDSHITYSAVQQLNHSGEILSTNSLHVEQGSSLLHVLLLSGFSQVAQFIPVLDSLLLPDIGLLFSLLAALLCLPITLKLAQLLGIKHPQLVLAALLLSVCFSYWAGGGLETSLVSLSILCFVLCSFYGLQAVILSASLPPKSTIIRVRLYAAYCLSAFALITVRPEHIAVSICFLLAVFTALFFSLNKHKHADETCNTPPYFWLILLSVAPLIISFAAVTFWRFEVFQLYFPQPVFAKASGLSIDHVLFGLAYFAYSAQLSIVLLSVGVVSAALSLLIKPKALSAAYILLICCLSFSVSYLAFIIFSGGDWMLGGRFFAHIAPLLFLCAFYFIQGSNRAKTYTIALLILLSIESLFFAYSLSTGIPANKDSNVKEQFKKLDINTQAYAWSELHNSVHLLDILFVDAIKPIIENIQSKPDVKAPIRIASVQMGMTPYHLNQLFPKQLYFIDMRGLSSQELSHCIAFDHYKRRQTGIYVRHDQYIAAAQQGLCELPLPDIIYDLSGHSNSFHQRSISKLTALGYTVVWQQSGGISHGLQLGRVGANAYIAVSNDVFKQLPKNLQQRQQHFSFVY